MSTTSGQFVHLHVHTEYSLLDGASRIEHLLKRAEELGMPALAITDHGNMHGVAQFYEAARETSVKPIIGFEAYVAPGSRHDKRPNTGGEPDGGYHLTLLATNETGYLNLLKLSSIAYIEGFYYKPRIDKELIQQHAEGVIALSGCLGGEVQQWLVKGRRDKAVEAASFYRDTFGPENFYIELQDTGEKEQKEILPKQVELARELGVPIVASNDSHYVRQEDALAQDVLICINTGKLLNDPGRMKFEPNYYLKSAEEMRELFRAWPESLANTLEIAERCNLSLDLDTMHYPRYEVPGDETAEHMLRRLCEEGIAWRYGEMTDELRARLDHELGVINGKGFADYFLIVWDFVNYARTNGIPSGARGSGVGTLVGYALGISTVDPIKHDLLFERFMDPERNEMPDIDIDICQNGRARVIEYVREKYGRSNVAQICTFGTLAARGVIRDVGRVLDVPLPEVDSIAKLVPTDLHITLEEALEKEPKLRERYEKDSRVREIIDIGMRLEGLSRNLGVHAAAVVIADKPLDRYVPLATSNDDVITQWPGTQLDRLLLKMDFLGLRTLTTLQRAVDLVKSVHGREIDLEKIPMDDPKVFELFGTGRTSGIFQFESDGMRRLLMKMGPQSINDLIASNALYRPGAMTMIEDYIRRHHGEDWTTPHPIMTEVLQETYGIMVYQEQVMRIANRLGDIPLRRAYKLIKAISKKKMEVIQAEQKQFVKGCVEKGIDGAKANEVFELIKKFGGYGFNKSHSTGYAYIAYQAGYLKTYYPVEYMAAVLTFESGSTEKVAQYIKECRDMGIPVLPPDVNESFVDFTVVDEKIRFGLGAVKGVGTKAIESILAARKDEGHFTSLAHLCSSVDLRAANKTVFESLNDCGAFDSLGMKRSQVAAVLEDALRLGQSKQADKRKGQIGLFDALGDEGGEEELTVPDVPEWAEKERLVREKNALGIYVSSHPMGGYEMDMEKLADTDLAGLAHRRDGSPVTLVTMISGVRRLLTKKNQAMARLVFEDTSGECEAVIFPQAYEEYGELLEVDKVVVVRGTVDGQDDRNGVKVDEVLPIEAAWPKLVGKVGVKLDAADAVGEPGARLRDLLQQNVGGTPVIIRVQVDGAEVLIECGAPKGVSVSRELALELCGLVGRGSVYCETRAWSPPVRRFRRRAAPA